jgi:hypothetical protein
LAGSPATEDALQKEAERGLELLPAETRRAFTEMICLRLCAQMTVDEYAVMFSAPPEPPPLK